MRSKRCARAGYTVRRYARWECPNAPLSTVTRIAPLIAAVCYPQNACCATTPSFRSLFLPSLALVHSHAHTCFQPCRLSRSSLRSLWSTSRLASPHCRYPQPARRPTSSRASTCGHSSNQILTQQLTAHCRVQEHLSGSSDAPAKTADVPAVRACPFVCSRSGTISHVRTGNHERGHRNTQATGTQSWYPILIIFHRLMGSAIP